MPTTTPKSVKEATDLPEPLRAAHLAFLIMKKLDAPSWLHVCKHPELWTHVEVTPEQQQLIFAHHPILQYCAYDPQQLPFLCTKCGRVGFVGKGKNPPTKCTLTFGCGGALAKTPRTTRATAKKSTRRA